MNIMEKKLEEAASHLTEGCVLVHSDLYEARFFIQDTVFERNKYLDNYVTLLEKNMSQNLAFPVFNYEFCRKGCIDLRKNPSQVGPLGEFLRQKPDYFRSWDPVFSVVSKIQFPSVNQNRIIAFGEGSIFKYLYDYNGNVFLYGAKLSHATILHLVELKSIPLYRYDKKFFGILTDMQGKERPIEYLYHARPWKMNLDYHWERLEKALQEANILKCIEHDGLVIARYFRAKDMVDFLVKKMSKDPYFLLNDASRQWAEPMIKKLGRRLLLSDFEK